MSEPASQAERSIHRMIPFPGAVPEVGVWLWAMGEVRRNLLNTLARIEQAGFGQEFYDWRGPDSADNSVGSLLYHVAGVELGWLYFDVLGTGLPADLKELFPLNDRTEDGKLRHVKDVPIEEHLARLKRARQRFLEVVGAMSLDEWNDLKSPAGEDYSMTPAWTVYHLVEHESGHLYEVRRLVRKWLETRGAG